MCGWSKDLLHTNHPSGQRGGGAIGSADFQASSGLMHQNLLVDPIICNSVNFYTHSLLRTIAGKSDEGYSGVSMAVTTQDGCSRVKLNPYNHKLHKGNLVVQL